MSHRHLRRPFAWGAATLLLGSNALAQEKSTPPETAPPALQAPAAAAADGLVAGTEVLLREALVREVLARNPSLEAARAAMQAAKARAAQAGALEAPMLSYSLAPLSIASSQVPFGQQVEVGQELPWPGKLSLREEVAEAEAAAARGEVEEVRLRLGLVGSQLYDDYFLVHRALSVNEEHQALLRTLKASAEAQYVAGRASQQDPLQAEVELSHLLREQVSLKARLATVRAQLNALLHRAPRQPLPPAPDTLPLPEGPVPESEVLQAQAIERRPELAALRARVGGREAAVKLARRGYLPDFRVMGSYNSMWMKTPHQYMAGVTLSLPFLQPGRRKAEVEEAQAELSNVRAEEQRLLDTIGAEVEEGRERLLEAREVVELYRTRVLPAARDQVAAARAGFESGRNDFLAVVEAEKNLRTAQLRLEESLADVHRRQAELSRSVGLPPALPAEGDTQ